ncbi:Enoyl-CoA hydratase/carnithine racemase [Gemmobacter megaterium]|uniref:Enoyl-CoA hydratase/carnithine racemase n=1 Tax=Gemmobacter megaterium TaxID=1086013 RepID=A0A1N7KKL3_9RHOB|nr:crotonase/enoyl-CoA hydratase family protein [Gemmobacter megaterium]GGE02664.1 enoyl-CoA hydratase [Gemmobacter megaterium]SIS62152.1 Enoyl-CoA hydratase/carnithine racemase [Gemmobacter megaterium]
MDPRLTITRNGPLAEIMLNRPDKRNALDMGLFDALAAAGDSLKGATGLRAVILHGAGAAFCAGIDTAEFLRMAQSLATVKAEMLAPARGQPNRFQRPVTVWAELGVPVIAAVHGVAFGAGLQLALGADFRIAAPDAKLSIMEARWGLIPDMGLTQSLPRLMRADLAKELILSARVLDAPEALALGLITRLAEDPLAEARAMAARFAQLSPDVLRAGKRLVEETWTLAPGEGLSIEAALQADLIASPNQIEAVTAGMQNRAPKFTG